MSEDLANAIMLETYLLDKEHPIILGFYTLHQLRDRAAYNWVVAHKTSGGQTPEFKPFKAMQTFSLKMRR